MSYKWEEKNLLFSRDNIMQQGDSPDILEITVSGDGCHIKRINIVSDITKEKLLHRQPQGLDK
jgi:acid stress-induced BolA-like protein IbaG/YrbA